VGGDGARGRGEVLELANGDRAWWEEDEADGGRVWDEGPVREVGKERGGGFLSIPHLCNACSSAASAFRLGPK